MKRATYLFSLMIAACSSGGSSTGDTGTTDPKDAETSDLGPRPDLGTMDAASDVTVEIGTSPMAFMPIMTGEVVPFIQGPQGGGRYEGYHLWGSMRARGLGPAMVDITFRYLRASDPNDEIASERRVLTLQPEGTGAYVAYGFAPRIHDCCLVLGTEVIMRVEASDPSGKSGFDERTIMTEARCVEVTTGQSVCP